MKFMRYTFKDILEDAMYSKCSVIFVTGPYGVFNNIVIDRLREMCTSHEEFTGNTAIDNGIMEEFGIDTGEVSISNSIPLESFMTQVSIPSISGKWFCSANLHSINKKQLEWLKNYIKSPSSNGVLCVWSDDFKDYRPWMSNKILLTSTESHIVSLSFPNKRSLYTIVKGLFDKRNVNISDKAVDLFITRMSSSYEDYEKIIDKICIEHLPSGYMSMDRDELPEISYEMALESMKGIENFVLEDFLEKLTEPLTTDKPSGKKRIYKMMGYLIEEYGACRLARTLKSKIDELMEFRVAINNGYIPILVNYNIDEAKNLIGEDNPISKKSDYQFKRLAEVASKTSLADWALMSLILLNSDKTNERSCIKAIYSLVSRSVLSPMMLSNDVGLDMIFSDELALLDDIIYLDVGELDKAIKELSTIFS